MIEIPYLSNVQSAAQGASGLRKSDQVDTGGEGLDMLGQTISKIGQAGFDHGIKIQRIENERQVQELQLRMEEAQSQFKNEIMNDFTPETWKSRYNKALSGALSGSNYSNLAPEARAKFDGWKNEFTSKTSLAIERDAEVQMIKRAEISEQTTIDRYIALGNYDAAADIISNSTIRSPEEKDASLFKILDYRKKEAKSLIYSEVELKNQEDPYYDGTNDLVEAGFDQTQINKYQLSRNKITKRYESDVIDDVSNGAIEGRYNNTDEALAMYPNAPERLRSVISKQLETIGNLRNAQEKEFDVVAGETRSYISQLEGFDPSSEDEQADYAKVYGKITAGLDRIKDDKDLHGELTTLLSFAKEKNGDKEGKGTNNELLKDVLDKEFPYTATNSKPPIANMSLGQAILDGVAQDPERLAKYGLEAFEGDVSGDKAFKAQLNHFRIQYEKKSPEERKNLLGTLEKEDPALLSVFQASFKGSRESSEIEWQDQELVEEYHAERERQLKQRESVQTELRRFKLEAPRTETEIKEKAQSIKKQLRLNAALGEDEVQSYLPTDKGTFDTKNLVGVVASRGMYESDDSFQNAKFDVDHLLKTHYKDHPVSEAQKTALILHEIRRGKGSINKLTRNGERSFSEMQKYIYNARNAGDYRDKKEAEEEYWLLKDTEVKKPWSPLKKAAIMTGYMLSPIK